MAEQSYTTSTEEYYIRKEGDEDSRGPFTVEQLASLVDAGQVDKQTYYYDALTEKWIEIQSNADLVTVLFPIKKKLSIRAKEGGPAINRELTDEEEPITVEEMLAAAKGETEDTKDKKDLTIAQARAALWGLRLMSVIMLISSAGLLVSHMDLLAALDFFPIISNPLMIFGAIDLLLALLLFLEVTSIYSLVRVRAVLGLGFFLIYFLATQEPLPALAAAVGSLAIYCLTQVARMPSVFSFGILGLAGMGGFAYVLLS